MKYLVVLFLCLSLNCFGQVCDDGLFINEYDNIKDIKHIKTKFMSYNLSLNDNYTFVLELRDKEIYLISTSTRMGVNGYNSEIGIEFSNDSSFLVKFTNSSNPSEELGKITYYNEIRLTFQQVKMFSERTISKIHQYGIDNTIEVKSRRADKIREYSNCFISNISEEKDLKKQEDFISSKSEIPSYYKPCNIVVDKIDEFEGYHKKQLHYAGIAKPTNNGFPLFINLMSYDSALWMTVELNAISYCVNKDSKVNFKLENDEIVRMQHLGEINCGKSSKYLVKFSKKDMEMLKESPIKLIRLETADGNFDLPIILIEKYFIENIDCL